MRLNLSGNRATIESGWEAFSEILCNTSSINSTYLSNHTLNDRMCDDLPINLSSLLVMNRDMDIRKKLLSKRSYVITPTWT
mmetsp:Transcript_20095/g.36317  ORF Transcript_20095/g.36317 Transcript_20095/m.36317 type:complete len:81 (+) Transcript_20095:58-300(+)